MDDIMDRRKGGLKITADEAAGFVKSGDTVVWGHSSSVPWTFINALCARAGELDHVNVRHPRIEGEISLYEEQYAGVFYHDSWMIAPNTRDLTRKGRASYTPCCFGLSDMLLLNGHVKPADVGIIQVSSPDQFGHCSFGLCCSYLPAVARTSTLLIAEVNSQLPFTGGASIHISDFDYFYETDHPISGVNTMALPVSEIDQTIGCHVAKLVEDGSTLQMGIGSIPNAVLSQLGNHKDLGIHTEMFGDGIMSLMHKGVITGRRKTLHRSKVVSTFVMGTLDLYSFLDRNAAFELRSASYTNNPDIISQQYKMVAINSALAVDLTGQICAESVGTYQVSGTGGQLDFALGAIRAQNGKFIIAMPSTAMGGKVSRITTTLLPGSTVTTPRTLADYIVTEYGIASLRGKSIQKRVQALIEISHPDFREPLAREAAQRKDIHLF